MVIPVAHVFVVMNEVLDVFKISTAFFAFFIEESGTIVVENIIIRKLCKYNCFYARI